MILRTYREKFVTLAGALLLFLQLGGCDPALIGTVPGVGTAKDVVIVGNRAYVASQEFGLSISDITTPSAPKIMGVSFPPFHAERVAVSGSLAVLSGNSLGLKVVSITDPRRPTVLSSIAGTMKGVAIAGQYAYAIEVVPGNPARTDLIVINLKTPSAPAIAGRVTVATASELRVVGTTAYLAARTSGLQLVNLANPGRPTILRTINTPDNAVGVSIGGRYAYVADGSAVRVIDLQVSTPSVVASLTMAATALSVEGTRLYVLDGLQLKVVDVANPRAPVLRAATSAFASQNLDATGTYAFLASPDVDVAAKRGGLYVFDVNTPTAPRVLTNLLGMHDNWGIGVAGSIGVVAGNSLGLKVVNVSNPELPVTIGSLAGTIKGATISGQYAYVINVVPGNPARIELAVVDLRAPATPRIVGRITLASSVDVRVAGTLAYVAASGSGMYIVDISAPTAPRLLSTLNTAGSAKSIALSGSYAYVADDNALLVVNVSNRASPRVVKTIATLATFVHVAGTRLYAIGGLQLKIYDLANPAAPVLRSATTARGAQAIQVVGNTALLATPAINHFDVNGGIYAIDVANAAQPKLITHIITPGTTRTLTAANGYVYAGDSAGIIDVIDLSP